MAVPFSDTNCKGKEKLNPEGIVDYKVSYHTLNVVQLLVKLDIYLVEMVSHAL